MGAEIGSRKQSPKGLMQQQTALPQSGEPADSAPEAGTPTSVLSQAQASTPAQPHTQTPGQTPPAPVLQQNESTFEPTVAARPTAYAAPASCSPGSGESNGAGRSRMVGLFAELLDRMRGFGEPAGAPRTRTPGSGRRGHRGHAGRRGPGGRSARGGAGIPQPGAQPVGGVKPGLGGKGNAQTSNGGGKGTVPGGAAPGTTPGTGTTPGNGTVPGASNSCGANGCNASGPVPDPAASAYHTQVVPSPNPPVANQPVSLKLNVTGPDGKPVTQFDPIMGESMHLMMVSSDLSDFQHVHPVLGPDGTFTVQVPGLKPGLTYDAMMEFDPKGAEPLQANRVQIVPQGAQSVAPNLAAELQRDTAAGYQESASGTGVALRTASGNVPALKAGQSEDLVFDLVDSKTGQPIQDLQNWMGMPIHVMGYTPDGRMAYHWHGAMAQGAVDGQVTTTGDGRTQVTVPVSISQPGLYKIFAQVNRGGEIVTLPFVIQVS